MKLKSAMKFGTIFGLLLVTVTLPSMAIADVDPDAAGSTAIDAFDDIWYTLVALLQGTFGRIIALLVIIAGVIAGIRTGSLMAFLSGAAVGVLLFFAPSIIEALQGQVVSPELMIEMLNDRAQQ